MPLELHCRFDAEHGPFGSPITLQQHYKRDHAAEYHADTAECPECRKRISSKNLIRHRRDAHGVETGPGSGRSGQSARRARLRCDLCQHTYNGIESARKHFQRKHPDVSFDGAAHMTRVELSTVSATDIEPHRPARNGHAPEPHPWHVDDIVMPVVGQLAEPTGMVPVAALAAIFVWRDATLTMLASVTTSARG